MSYASYMPAIVSLSHGTQCSTLKPPCIRLSCPNKLLH